MIVAGVVGLVIGVLVLCALIPAAVLAVFIQWGWQGAALYVLGLAIPGGIGWVFR